MEETLLIRCPDCKKLIDLGFKSLETYKKSIAVMLNKKCPYCDELISETCLKKEDWIVV